MLLKINNKLAQYNLFIFSYIQYICSDLTAIVRNCLESRLKLLLPQPSLVSLMKQLISVDKRSSSNELIFMPFEPQMNDFYCLDLTHLPNLSKLNNLNFQSKYHQVGLKRFNIKMELDITSDDNRTNVFDWMNMGKLKQTNDKVENGNCDFDLSASSTSSSSRLLDQLICISKYCQTQDLGLVQPCSRLGILSQTWRFSTIGRNWILPIEWTKLVREKFDQDRKIEHLSWSLQKLVYGIKSYLEVDKSCYVCLICFDL